MQSSIPTRKYRQVCVICIISVLFCVFVSTSKAATLQTAPSTGVYSVGQSFTVQIRLNSEGETINAAEGSLRFNPSEVSVLGISKGSMFSLWSAEPTYSNSDGTIEFSGGTPSGYTGSNGVVMTVTMQTKSAGSPKLKFTDGAVLAADGRGTNVLNNMSGGSYTITAIENSPEAEVVEYVAPPDTPAAPSIESGTHPDPDAWYAKTAATLAWSLPAGVTQVRTLLDTKADSVPSKVYESPIREIELEDLEEGEQYFHLQFRNEDGWGAVSHYRLAVDTTAPQDLQVQLAEGVTATDPQPVLQATVTEATSYIERYLVSIDDEEPITVLDEERNGLIPLPELSPGYHTFVIEAFDAAGNSTFTRFSHTVESFTAPKFVDVPEQINDTVIPVLQGETVPDANVRVWITRMGGVTTEHEVTSDSEGMFTVIPDDSFAYGVYELTAQATDDAGAVSEISKPVRMLVEQPNILKIGSLVVSVMSVLVPVLALLLLLIMGTVYSFVSIRNWKRRLSKETSEVSTSVVSEFDNVAAVLEKEAARLRKGRKNNRLNKKEEALFNAVTKAIRVAKGRITKEVRDVEDIVD